MFAKVVLLSTLVSSAFATVFITSPTSSSTFNGGQSATITWMDDGNKPSLSDWQNASVAIYTGNANQQTLLQTVTPSVNVSSTSSIQFNVDASIGPNGKEYFIRMQSLTLKDANNTQYPQMAFSAMYTMASMTGTFNASVSAEIAGQSTAPIGGSSSAPAASGSSAAAATTAARVASTSAAASTTSAKNSSTTASASNGAVGASIANVWISAVFGVLLLALML